MNELFEVCQEIKCDLQGVIKSLAKITKTHSQILIDEWNRKEVTMKILGISSRTFNRLTKSGELPYSKIHGLIFIKSSDIERLLNDNYRSGQVQNSKN